MPGREDPLVGFYFAVEFKAAGVFGTFRECTGLGSENEVAEDKHVVLEGKHGISKQPGRLKWENIELKRGITSDLTMWKWRKKIQEGKVNEARSDGSIVLFNQAHMPVANWAVNMAWPSKLTGPALNAGGNEIAVEQLTIVHEGCYREK